MSVDLPSPRHYTKQFGDKIASLLDKLKPPCDFVSHNPHDDGLLLWESWEWDDKWDDSGIRDLIRYLYGSYFLKIPVEWKKLLPKQI